MALRHPGTLDIGTLEIDWTRFLPSAPELRAITQIGKGLFHRDTAREVVSQRSWMRQHCGQWRRPRRPPGVGHNTDRRGYRLLRRVQADHPQRLAARSVWRKVIDNVVSLDEILATILLLQK